MASDADFFVVRRFDRLNMRVLLRLQDEISALEERLDEVENICMERESPQTHNGTFRQDVIPERTRLMLAITEKMERYSMWHVSLTGFSEKLKLTKMLLDSSVLTYSQLRALPIATERCVSSVENWLHDNRTAIVEQESEFVKKKDLISLGNYSKPTLRGFFDTFVAFRNHWPWREASDEQNHQEDQSIQFIKTNCLELVLTLSALVAELLMFIMPLWFLDILQDPCARFGLIIVFIMAFVRDHVGCCDA